jgi:hypothetical protein
MTTTSQEGRMDPRRDTGRLTFVPRIDARRETNRVEQIGRIGQEREPHSSAPGQAVEE